MRLYVLHVQFLDTSTGKAAGDASVGDRGFMYSERPMRCADVRTAAKIPAMTAKDVETPTTISRIGAMTYVCKRGRTDAKHAGLGLLSVQNPLVL